MQSCGFPSPLPDFGQEGVLGAIQPIFLARVRVRRFTEKAFTLHHGSQAPDTKSLMGEGFTLFSLHLYLHTLPLRAIALRPSPLYV